MFQQQVVENQSPHKPYIRTDLWHMATDVTDFSLIDAGKKQREIERERALLQWHQPFPVSGFTETSIGKTA